MKKEIKYFLIALCFCFTIPVCFSQDKKTADSLIALLKTAKEDTVKLNLISETCNYLPEEEWPAYNEQMGALAKKLLESTDKKIQKNASRHYGNYLSNLGYIYDDKGEINKALDCYQKALTYISEGGSETAKATVINNIGLIYHNQGNVALALEQYYKSLKILEKSADSTNLSETIINIGSEYELQGNHEKAFEYFRRALSIREKTNNRRGVAESLNNIGYVYAQKSDYRSALNYYEKSLKTSEEISDKRGIAKGCNNIGSMLQKTGSVKEAIPYFERAIKIWRETENIRALILSMDNLAGCYLTLGQTAKAEKTGTESFLMAEKIAYPDVTARTALLLKNVFKEQGKYNDALKMYELYIKMNDSISNQETKKAGVKKELQYEYEKKSAADSVKNAESQKVKDAQLAAQKASLKQEKFQRYSLAVGLLLVICGLLFVINRFRITRKQKKIIEEQKLIVDNAFEKLHEKNKEVMDSIHYAKRIQTALLTSEKYIERILNRLS